MNELELTGRARTHVLELEQPHCILHYEVVAAFLAMRDTAARFGIDLQAASSFRDFGTQLRIWNQKWNGTRPVLDPYGRKLERDGGTDAQWADAILRWSAIPGGSRHHWGSDLDIIDRAAMPAGYRVQLVPEEYAPDGVFAKITTWLDDNMSHFGFFRPYATDRGGVCPEPWHLSYAPVAVPALESLSLSLLRQTLNDTAFEGKAEILGRLPEIYTRFLLAVDFA